MGHRYIGAKSRILGQILPIMEKIVEPGDCVADLMCGTSAVSAALRQKGFEVIANDLMTYSYHHAKVSLLFTEPICPTLKYEAFILDNRPPATIIPPLEISRKDAKTTKRRAI